MLKHIKRFWAKVEYATVAYHNGHNAGFVEGYSKGIQEGYRQGWEEARALVRETFPEYYNADGTLKGR